MFNIIGAVISGLLVGILARWFYPGDVPLGMFKTILLGVGGSLLAGLIIAAREPGGIGGGFSRAGCLSSVLGAMVLIFIGRQLGW